jgi:hypothetical protein
MAKNTTKQKTSSHPKIEEVPVEKKFDVFTFVGDISKGKKNLFSEETADKYDAYIINKAFSLTADTILYANDMNLYYNLPKVLQHDYLINSIRPRSRYEKWPKAEKSSDIDAIKEYYKYSDAKARSALSILSKGQLAIIKEKLEKGGITK